MGGTQQTTTSVPSDTAPCQRVNTKTKIAMTPGNTKRLPPQTEPHISPDDTEVLPPDAQPYDGTPFKIPLVHRYNIRARRLKRYNLMANHMTTISSTIKMPTPSITNTSVH